ncbi:DoxX family protein [Lichenibacterium dinghuense]|uniref:DoxX family protein n=1 Tax=Lichenibacterium dinghuense TaxID=2895977 RepID=UPI001F42E8AF|nr:DoxX family protein [Lichenibacterium sp. 6Y81]
MTNPISDTLLFLVGDSGDYNSLSAWKYVSVAFYLALLAASAFIVWRNWAEDPSQRSGRNVGILAMRVVMAGLWFEGTIWKLPLPVSGGFSYWLGQEAKFSAVGLQAAFVRDALVPHVALLQPVVYAIEIAFTVSLTLGLAVRLSGLVAVLFTLQLWLGLYNDPTEWPWTYIAIAVAQGMFAAFDAGRCLGLDGLLRIRNAAIVRGDGLSATLYRLAS